jgi:hypothetical protein
MVSELLPTAGHWIAAVDRCDLTMDCSAGLVAESFPPVEMVIPTWKSSVSVEDQELAFGMHPDATDGFDSMLDKPLPPFPEASGDVKKRGGKKLDGVLKAAWLIADRTFPMLSESYVKEGAQGTWELSLDLPRPGKVEWSDLPEGYECILLYDKRSIDMKAKNFLPLPLGKHSLTLVLDASNSVPKKPRLLANYPNPFNPETWIPYELEEDGHVLIRIYNATGHLVRVLNLGHKPAGFYTSRDRACYWNGENEAGERVASGIYFYTIQAGDFTATRKMVMSK